MKEKHGEFIHIYWEDDSEVEYVRGHVTLDEAKAAIRAHSGEGADDSAIDVKHRWARWVPAERYSDFSCLLWTYDEKSKGAFAVTEVRMAPTRTGARP